MRATWLALVLCAVVRGEGDGSEQKRACPTSCGCAIVEGEPEYLCRAGSATVRVRAVRDDFVRIYCQEGILLCSEMPNIPISQNGTLNSVSMSQCALPASFRCLLARFGAADVKAIVLESPKGELTREHVVGLRETNRLALYEAADQTKLPYDALAELPQLKDFRLHDAHLELEKFDNSTQEKEYSSLKFMELSSDRIKDIPSSAFRRMRGIESLQLVGNDIANLTGDVFIGLESLKRLDLSRNPLRSLPPGVFTHTPHLTALSLTQTALSHLPKGALALLLNLEQIKIQFGRNVLTFEPQALGNLPALKKISLDRCKLAPLPEDLLEGDISLEHLDIVGTGLEVIPANLFRGLQSLRVVNVINNKIKALPGQLFAGLRNLEVVMLDDNQIASIAADAFQSTTGLRKLSLARNRLTLRSVNALQYYEVVEYQSPFSGLLELTELVLRENAIAEIFSDWRFLLIHNLRKLDLSWNNFTSLTKADVQFLSNKVEVDLRHNKIEFVDVDEAPDGWRSNPVEQETSAVILLDDNPFRCDCQLFSFVKRLKGSKPMTSEPRLVPGDARCHSPSSLAGNLIKNLSLSSLSCDLYPQDCPNNCSCTFRPETSMLELDCLEEVSLYPDPTSFSAVATRLRLHTPISTLSSLPSHIVAINLRGVGLKHVGAVPSTIKELDLSHNNLSHPPNALSSDLTMRLAGNPFICDCSRASDVVLLQQNFKKIIDAVNVTCNEKESPWNVDAARLCYFRHAGLLGGLLAAFGVVAAIVAFLQYRYSLEIKIFLFSRGWFTSALAKEEPGADMEYDAFVSFAHNDAKWVSEELVPKLENEFDMKLCVHYRDWVVGDLIPLQISRSVERSRRTIIILSENFLTSVWAPLEFRAAHVRAQRERCTRVLVIVLGDLPKATNMDEELRAYLTTNTYLKWGDPWFWEKLVYALPHKKKKSYIYPDKINPNSLDIRVSAGKNDKNVF
ncbi:hypothetical protein ACJJTC_019201 [Scirpophaga incertulas]